MIVGDEAGDPLDIGSGNFCRIVDEGLDGVGRCSVMEDLIADDKRRNCRIIGALKRVDSAELERAVGDNADFEKARSFRFKM